MDHATIVRTARTAVQAAIAAVGVAGIAFPLIAAHPEFGPIAGWAATGVAAVTAVTAAWNAVEANYPKVAALLPAWLQRDIAEVTE